MNSLVVVGITREKIQNYLPIDEKRTKRKIIKKLSVGHKIMCFMDNFLPF